jgi:SAM-dependent methyltransferase
VLNEFQRYELLFWKERWPYRDWSIAELQKLRHADASWFLTNLGFGRRDEASFEGFEGDVLEVSCGPIGFFELMRGVEVTAADPLLGVYAAEIPYAQLGRRGSTTYVSGALGDVPGEFDFVVCRNTMDATDDWMEFLEQMVEMLRPNGELLLLTDTRTRPTVGHPQVFTASQLRRVLGWLGLRRFHCFRADKPASDMCEHRVFVRAGI